jgi:hypothetical protein
MPRLMPWSPRLPARHRAGAPVQPPDSSTPFSHFRTAQSRGDVDLIERAEMDARRVHLPLTPSVAMPINNNLTAQMVGRPQGLFRAVRLFVGSAQDASGGFGVTVSDIFVGVDTCMAELGTLSAVAFQATTFDGAMTFPDAMTSMDVGCTVGNITGTTASIIAQMLGDFVKGGGIAMMG